MADMGEEAALDAIDQSMRQGWSGLFEPKGNGKPQTNPSKPEATDKLGGTHSEDYLARMMAANPNRRERGDA
jgi:hypothetical protein